MARPATFQDHEITYYADTCEPLRAAAARGELRLEAWSHGLYPGRRLPQEVLPELCSAGMWDAPRRQKWGLDWHCNEGIELTYVARGKVAFAAGTQTWLLRQGHLTITRPWQFHRVGNPAVAASQLCWLILDVGVRRPNQPWRWPSWLVCSPSDLQRLTALLRHNEQLVWRADAECARCFTRLTTILALQDLAQIETRLTLYINDVLVALLEMLQRHNIALDESLSTSYRTVELFLAALPEHVERQWTLEQMAEQCGLARSQFARYCKQITNMTPIEYLTHCRIELAARLLRDHPTLSVTEVAFRCGFQSSQYFATVFVSRRGVPPLLYRQQMRYLLS